MKITNKLIAAISAMSLIAVSFTSMVTISSATETPTVKAEIITGDELIAVDDGAEAYDIGLKVSFTNFEKDIKAIAFNLKVPSDIKAQNKKGLATDFTAANLKNYSIYYDNSAFDDGWGNTTTANDYGEGWTRAYISWLNWADGGSAVYFDTEDSNYFVISLRAPSEDYVLPEGSFEIADLEVAYYDAVSPLEDVKLVDPTTSAATPEPTATPTPTPVVTEAPTATPTVEPTPEVTPEPVAGVEKFSDTDAAAWAWETAAVAGSKVKVTVTDGTTEGAKTFDLNAAVEGSVKVGVIVQYNPTAFPNFAIVDVEIQ